MGDGEAVGYAGAAVVGYEDYVLWWMGLGGGNGWVLGGEVEVERRQDGGADGEFILWELVGAVGRIGIAWEVGDEELVACAG